MSTPKYSIQELPAPESLLMCILHTGVWLSYIPGASFTGEAHGIVFGRRVQAGGVVDAVNSPHAYSQIGVYLSTRIAL
jgi:hypothetical protein